MINIAETKELLEDKEISDEEAKEIRDICYALAELSLEIWREEINNNQKINDR
ncbi:MAG: hypothetical protein ABIF18_00970 [archaeon]